MAKKTDSRETWQVIEDLWNKYKRMYPNLKIPLRFIDEQSGLKVGTCSPIWYSKTKVSEHKEALLACEKRIKKIKV